MNSPVYFFVFCGKMIYMEIKKQKQTFIFDNYLWGSKREDTTVSLTLSCDKEKLYFEFNVTEKELRRMVVEDNGSVWLDSCMELFISPDNVNYYNFEFSASKALRCGYGPNRQERPLVDSEKLKLVEREIVVLENNNKRSRYSFKGSIPLKEFGLDKEVLYLNAYKCGDGLKEPHFISLFNIDLPNPDFHQIKFFKPVKLIKA